MATSYPWNSVYAFSENRVIDAIELEGLESFRVKEEQIVNGNGATQISVEYDESLRFGIIVTTESNHRAMMAQGQSGGNTATNRVAVKRPALATISGNFGIVDFTTTNQSPVEVVNSISNRINTSPLVVNAMNSIGTTTTGQTNSTTEEQIVKGESFSINSSFTFDETITSANVEIFSINVQVADPNSETARAFSQQIQNQFGVTPNISQGGLEGEISVQVNYTVDIRTNITNKTAVIN